MAFENFPYTNFHEINLDWIVARVKEAYSASNPPDYPVKSVNGMTGDVIIAIPANLVQSVNGETGDVILYRNPLVQFPTTTEQRWNLFRICDGDERGIEFDEDGAHRIEGTRRILIYDEENQPDFPVTSVNGQTGDVRITAGVNSVNGKTGNVVTPFVNPNADILKLDSNSNTILWGIARDVAGGEIALYITRGTGSPQAFIRYTPTDGQAINLPLLTNADIPADAGVISVNTKTGSVTLYGTDILLNETASDSIAAYILNINYNIDGIITSLMDYDPGTVITWNTGYYSAGTGEFTNSSNHLRTRDFITEKYCMLMQKKNSNLVFALSAWDSETQDSYVGVLNRETKTFAPDTTLSGHFYKNINLQELREMYPQYKFKIICRYEPITNIYQTAIPDIELYYPINQNGDSQAIEELTTTVEEHTSQISALQAKDTSQDRQISTLQAKDTSQDQQISALQDADSGHSQQISALQAADATHDQQISALQAKDNTQDQQISELYTRTGIYVISIPNANTLPLRYPASGTDDKIKDTNKVVSMDLSIPGAQVSNWTITTYDGYLEISGTINGGTDITLYLA